MRLWCWLVGHVEQEWLDAPHGLPVVWCPRCSRVLRRPIDA